MRLPAGGGGDFAPPMKKAATYAEEEEKGLPIYHAAVCATANYMCSTAVWRTSAPTNPRTTAHTPWAYRPTDLRGGQDAKELLPRRHNGLAV